jgi:hypothetical protein
MANFSPAYAYPMDFPEPQYYGDARYPGNTVFATTGAFQNAQAAKAAVNNLLQCPMAYVSSGVVGAVLFSVVNYFTHMKLIRKKKMKIKNLLPYTLQGALVTPAAFAAALGLLYAYYNMTGQ